MKDFNTLPDDAIKIQEFVNKHKQNFEYGKIQIETAKGIGENITLNKILMNSTYSDK